MMDTTLAEKLFPKSKESWSNFEREGGYWTIVQHIGEVALNIDKGDYQGDSYVLFKSPKWGFLAFGWGSCSGCDAFEACDNHEDLQSLIESMVASVRWFDSPKEALEWFDSKDWKTEWMGYKEELKEVISEMKAFLADHVE